MVLFRRSPGWYLSRGIGAGAAFVGVTAAWASVKSAEIDQEFLTTPYQPLQRRGRERVTDPDVAKQRLRALVDNSETEAGEEMRPYTRPWSMRSNETPAVPYDRVASSLSAGDIYLAMGTGPMSWRITRLAFLLAGWNTDGLRYSHVGLVVSPLPPQCLDTLQRINKKEKTGGWWGRKASPASQTPMLDALAEHTRRDGRPLVLEAIDNKDVQAGNLAPDPSKIVFDQAMIGALEDRLFGIDPSSVSCPGPRWTYSRAAVRHVEGIDWGSEEVVRGFDKFLSQTVGRPMDKDPKLTLTIAHPSLHTRPDPRTISCSELIADGWRALRFLPPCSVEEYGRRGNLLIPSIMYAPIHFTTLGQQFMGWDYATQFVLERQRLWPEVRVDMRRTLVNASEELQARGYPLEDVLRELRPKQLPPPPPPASDVVTTRSPASSLSQ